MDYSDRLIIITGPTATGKTRLGIELAGKFSGEIISADSRQVYKFMDIGTGKDKMEYQKAGVKVWGIDLVEPDYRFNVADWVEYARTVISDIRKRGKLPIIVGGTGLYLRSFLYPPDTINVPVSHKLRGKLDKFSVEKLHHELLKIDRNKWEKMNDSDRHNPRRLIRAIEVALQISKIKDPRSKQNSKIQIRKSLIIGLTADRNVINDRIDRRVDDRMDEGMEEEVKNLVKKGYSWDLPSMSGIGYRGFMNYELGIRNNYLPPEILNTITQDWKVSEHQYTKRQMTYLKKYLPEAKWFDISSSSYKKETFAEIRTFLV